MPMIRVNGTALYYEDTGGSGTPIVFSHGLLWNSSLFAPQIASSRRTIAVLPTIIAARAEALTMPLTPLAWLH